MTFALRSLLEVVEVYTCTVHSSEVLRSRVRHILMGVPMYIIVTS